MGGSGVACRVAGEMPTTRAGLSRRCCRWMHSSSHDVRLSLPALAKHIADRPSPRVFEALFDIPRRTPAADGPPHRATGPISLRNGSGSVSKYASGYGNIHEIVRPHA